MVQSDTYQDISLAILYDSAYLRLSVTLTLASLHTSGITSAKYLRLGRIYDLIDVLLHVCCVACDNVSSQSLQITCSLSYHRTKIQTADLLPGGDTNSTYICPQACSSPVASLASIQTQTRNMKKKNIRIYWLRVSMPLHVYHPSIPRGNIAMDLCH